MIPVRPIAASMGLGVVVLLGSIAAARMPVTSDPRAAYPGLTVEVEYPGVSPEKMEEIVSRPLEEAAATLGSVRELSSTSEEGKSRLHVQFEPETNVQWKAMELRERVDLVASRFPREAHKPVITRYAPDQAPVLMIQLDHPAWTEEQLREFADKQLRKQLIGVDGVSEVYAAGGRIKEILIDCDRQRLQAFGLALPDLFRALSDSNFNLAAGRITDGGLEKPLVSRGRFQTLDQIRALILHIEESGKSASLGDVARVSFEYREPESAARVNGVERVMLYVHRASGADLPALSAGVKAVLGREVRAPVKAEIIYDQGAKVSNALRDTLFAAAVSLTACAGLLSLLSRNVWPAIRAVLLVLISTTAALLVLFLTVGQISTLAVSGAFMGQAVNMARSLLSLHSDSLERRFTAAVLLCLGASLLPVFLSGSESARVFGPAVIMLFSCVALHAAAGIVFPFAHRLVPVPWRIPSVQARLRTRQISKVLERLSRIFRMRPLLPLGILAVSFLFLTIFARGLLDSARLENHGELSARIEMPSGTAFAATNQVSRKIEAILQKHPAIRQVTSRVETASSDLTLELHSGTAVTDELLDNLREAVRGHDPAFVHFGSGAGEADSEITVDVQGDDLATLDETVRALARAAGQEPSLKDVVLRYKSPRPEMLVVIDRARSGTTGLTARQIGESLRHAIQGGVATKFVAEGREYDVRIRFAREFRDKPDNINDIFLKLPSGGFVPVKEVALMQESSLPVKIFRKNKRRTYSFSIRPRGISPASAAALIREHAADLPPGYRLSIADNAPSGNDSLLKQILIAGSLLLLLTLAGWYESLVRPIAVLVPVPVVAGIVFAGLFLLSRGFSLGALLGVILSCSYTIALLMAAPDTALRRTRVWLARSLAASATLILFSLPAFALPQSPVSELLLPSALCLTAAGVAFLVAAPLGLAAPALLRSPRQTLRRAGDDAAGVYAAARLLPGRIKHRLSRRYFKS